MNYHATNEHGVVERPQRIIVAEDKRNHCRATIFLARTPTGWITGYEFNRHNGSCSGLPNTGDRLPRFPTRAMAIDHEIEHALTYYDNPRSCGSCGKPPTKRFIAALHAARPSLQLELF